MLFIKEKLIVLINKGVMRKKRRNTYVVNNINVEHFSSETSVSNSFAQSDTLNNDVSSTSTISSSISKQPAHGSTTNTFVET